MGVRERMPPAEPLSARSAGLLAGLAVALAALTALVASGALTRVDQFGIDHFMPWFVPGNPGRVESTINSFWRPFRLHTANGAKLLDLWTYPCSVVVSGVIMVVAFVLLRRRLGAAAALAPAAVWVVGNAIEVLGKDVITRPTLYGVANGARVAVIPYFHSFPSGHMMRGVIVAYTVFLLWSRAKWWATVWVVLVAPALVVTAAHTPSDVVGGALLGVILLIPTHAVVRGARMEHVTG
ncbi:MAG TPA: phosphatase PAP2 family protein [Gaiellaceae bacterium]|nr:phosphatase PAP2 family protein [Gaiellaceae bacterium]